MTLAEKIRTCTDDQLADLLLSLGVYNTMPADTKTRKKMLLYLLHTPYATAQYFGIITDEKP